MKEHQLPEPEPFIPREKDDDYWLQLARSSWAAGDDYFTTSLRPRIERNLSHYKSRHAPGSKYYTDAYAKRSKMFRPKTRSAIRKHAAAAIRALFATDDIMTCQPTNPSDKENVLAAQIHEAILNYRLKNSVPWYKIAVAALTEASINGIVISKQYWDYEEEEVEETKLDLGPAGLTTRRYTTKKVIRDRPMCRIVPIENIRISPASDWLDPMESSPFIIEQRPYFVADLKRRIETHSLIPYRILGESALRQGYNFDFDSIRAKREEYRDRFNEVFSNQSGDYDVVWVRECIVRVDKMDYYYETIGDNLLLSDPVPLSRVSRGFGRGYVFGSIEIEPHTLHPDGRADLAYQTQVEANEIANTRLDNVKLAMTGRYIVARGRQTDIRSLMRNVPGSITYSQNVNDVREIRPADVTASSYQEQDRLNLDMDDLLGTFSQSTVQSNRALNETVGGMNMLQEGANEIPEMEMRTFVETWYEPVLRQLVKLESIHESDANILSIVGQQVDSEGKPMTVGEVFRSITQPTRVAVNVGFGNTNPLMRIERLRTGLMTMEQFVPGIMQKVDPIEVAKEVWGALGHKDGSRFLPSLFETEEDPMVAQLQQQVQELQTALEMEQAKEQAKIQIEQIRAANRLEIEQLRAQVRQFVEQTKAQIKQIDQQIAQEKNEIAKRELYMQREALSHTILEAERRAQMEEIRFEKEMRQEIPDQPVDEEFIKDLRVPSSGTPIESISGSALTEATDNMAGVIARGDFGAIPGAEG